MKVVPIDNLVLDGLRQRLEQVFAAPVVLSNSSDAVQQLKKADKGSADYPFIIVALTELGTNLTGYRAQPMLRRGTAVTVTDDTKRVFLASVIPTTFTFELSYYDVDFKRCLAYAKAWAFAASGGWLKYTIQFGQAFDVHVALAETVSLPVREADPTNATEYVLTSSLTVSGYSSRDTLREMPVVQELDVEGVLRLNSAEGSQIFLFKRTPT